ncbi:MAG: FG-GAP-like repeat-containing protein, partial [Phycisphaerae bacterium]
MNGEDFALWDSAPLFEPLEARVLLSVSFPGQLYPVGEWPTAGALADFDEDGLPDVATANSNEPTVSVLLSDGRGGFADQRKLDVADKPEWLITADFNADGHADLATANDLANNVSVLLGNGDGTFQAHADFVVGQDPRYLASGDFNRDGHLDLAVTNYDDDTVSLLFGKGDGRFQAQELLSVGQSPWSVLAADLNDDGKLDLATADFDDDRLSVLLGNGDGTFVAQAPLVVRDGPQMVTCADLNEDGPPDLIVTNRREDTVSLLTGNGDGSFQAHREVSVEPNPMAVYAVDLDADSHLDLVTSHYGGEVCVLAGVGDGTFAGRAWYQSVAYSSLVPHDFDGDGDLDLAVPARHHDAVVILPNQGDGALLPRSEPVGASPDSVVTADFDGDGHLDLATSNMADDTASVLLGNGDGTFRAHVPYTVGDGPDYIVAADLDGDDVVDLAVTNSRDDTVSVLLGKGDGSFLGQEISVVGEDPQSPVVADFNNDEVPDLAVANNDVDTVSVLLGKGDGTFHDQRTSPAGPLPTALAAGDFDGDGFTDLVVVNSYELSLSLLLGVGDGTFHDPQAMAIDSSAHTIVSADLNGDGLDDLVVSHSDDIVSVRLGRGDGTFDSAGSYPVLDGAFDMDMADVDGDGRLDLVVANYWSQVLSVLTGNGDGTFGSRYDFACAGSRAAVAGDFDEDGAVDLAAADGRGSVIILLSTLDWDSRIDAPIRAGEILQGDTLRFAGAGWATRQPYGFRWGFGDGRSSTLETPGLVTFRTPGTFDVTFAVVDAVGASDPQPATLTLTVAADPGSAPDLVATTIELPEGLALGEPAEIAYTVVNEGDAAISGQSWHDALYLSADTWLDAGDLLLAESPTISQDLAPGETFSGIIEATIPAEAAGGTCYLILSADDGWEVLERHQLNNELAAAADVTIPELASGVPVSIAFTEDSRERYYRIDVPAGRNLLLSLDDLDDAGVNELYLQFAQLPTRGTFTARHAVSGEADQHILLPVPAPGTWYILAYAAEGPGECTLVAELEDLVVLDASPGCFVDVQPMALALTGAGFDGGTAVELVAGDATTYAPSSLTVDSYTRMTASFDAGTVPAGLYTVRVSKSGVAPVQLADAVEVVVGAEAELVTNLIVPDKLGYHALATIYLEYANTGDVAMPAPLLALTATQDGKPGARMTLDSSLVWQGFSISTMPEGFSSAIHILASGETPGQLGPHESCRVPVYWAGWEQPWDFSYPPFEFGLGVVTVDSTEPIDWASLKDQMRPRTVSAEAWEPVWENFIEQTGLTAGEYVAMLDDNAAYLGRLAERVLDIERLVNFEYHQANGLWPWQDLIEAVDVRIAAPGLPLTFQRSFSYEITGRYELGPRGYGWSHNWQWALEEGSDGTVRITTPTGGERVFGPARFGRYISEPGDYATLTALGGGAFLLTEPDGVAYAFRADGLLDYVEDLNGNRITAGYTDGLLTSLAHSCGQALQLEYNAAGRIERILDSYGREVAFTYDSSSGHLLDGKGTDNLTTHYSYSTGGTDIQTEHALTGIEYPDGTHR